MKLNKPIQKTLGSDEQVKKLFSYGNRHTYVRLALSLFKWLLVAVASAVVIVILYKFSEFAAKGGFTPMIEANGASIKIAGEELLGGFLARTIFIASFIFLFIFTPISLFYHLYYLKTANTFVFTDRRIIVKRGWLNTSVKSVNYDRITDVGVEQSFLDKILYATGTLSISTAGGDGYELTLNCVSGPHELKKLLYDLKEEYRRKAYPNPETKKTDEA